MVPFDIGFSWWRINQSHKAFQYFIEFYFYVDMLVSFRTAYVHDGHIITSPSKIAKHYLRHWFWIDLLACIPFESIASSVFKEKATRKAIKMLKWLKLPVLLRLGQLRKLLNAKTRMGHYVPFTKKIITMLFLVHFCSCSWVLMLNPCDAFNDFDWTYDSDVDRELVRNHPELGPRCLPETVSSVYFQAFHLASAIIWGGTPLLPQGPDGNFIQSGGHLQGYEDDLVDLGISSNGAHRETHVWGVDYWSPMLFFTSIFRLLGQLLLAGIVAEITKLVINRNPAETNFRNFEVAVNSELMRYGAQVTTSIHDRIKHFFTYSYTHQDFGQLRMLDEEYLARSTRAEIAICLHKDILLQVPFFERASVDILEEAALALRQEVYMPFDVIYRKGDMAKAIYFIELGLIVLTTVDIDNNRHNRLTLEQDSKDQGKLYVERRKGQIFGETIILQEILARPEEKELFRRDKSAVARGEPARLMALDVDVVRSLARGSPLFFKHLREYHNELWPDDPRNAGKDENPLPPESPPALLPIATVQAGSTLAQQNPGLPDSSSSSKNGPHPPLGSPHDAALHPLPGVTQAHDSLPHNHNSNTFHDAGMTSHGIDKVLERLEALDQKWEHRWATLNERIAGLEKQRQSPAILPPIG